MRERFIEALLLAALGHGNRAPAPDQRRAYALYFVDCAIRQLRKDRFFTQAFWAQDLLREMRASEKLYSLKAKYCPNRPPPKEEGGAPGFYRAPGDKDAPTGNTGATPRQLRIMEDYI